MIVDFTIAPIGAGEGLSPHIARAFEVIEKSKLAHEHHAMGTNLEGEWDQVMAVIRACRDRLLEDVDRLSITLKIDDRKGGTDRLFAKVASARAKMG